MKSSDHQKSFKNVDIFLGYVFRRKSFSGRKLKICTVAFKKVKWAKIFDKKKILGYKFKDFCSWIVSQKWYKIICDTFLDIFIVIKKISFKKGFFW